MNLERKPVDCIGLEDIRKHIDEIDREIIRLFSLRSEYVHEIVKFKTDEASVIAQERKDQVIRQRSEWAQNAGLDGNTFKDIYIRLLQQNISEELELLKKKTTSNV